jgi:acyl-CoA reductase-like NAD-dependent aldehyde dehydrogenase
MNLGTKTLRIGGESIQSDGTLPVVDPATAEEVGVIPEAGPELVDQAVTAARTALNGPWRALTPADRAGLLYRLAELIQAETDDLARLESIDNGKPLWASRVIDIPQVAEQFRYNAGWATKIHGDVISPSWPGHTVWTAREPVGVVAQITPWNFPMLMAARNAAPALAAGNTVIIKPSELTSLTTLRLGELAEEAGFPPGVLTVLSGRGEVTGAALTAHPDVDMICFTGGQKAAREVVKASAVNFKKLHLELGGKNPVIVFADTNLERTIPEIIGAAYSNGGQNCAAGTRVIVEESIRNELLERLAQATLEIQLGHPLEESTQMGPLVSAEHRDRVKSYVELGKSEGAELVVGGETTDEPGYFLTPALFTNASSDMRFMREEIFGPVAGVMTFGDEDEAVAFANDTEYGLTASVWTENAGRAHRMAKKLDTGVVWLNCHNRFDVEVPFGGVNRSGHGRDHGWEEILEFTSPKAVWIDHG